MERKRLDYIDTCKGILILLMVYGHVFLSGLPRQWLYTFHMPAFFIITGMMMNYASSQNKPFLAFLKSRIRTLIVPLLFFEVIGVLTDIVRYGFTLNAFGYAYNTISGNYNTGPNWFLFATFVAEMMLFLLHKIFRNKYFVIPIAFLIAVSMICNRNMFPNAGQTGIGLLFIVLGYYARCFFETDKHGTVALTFAISLFITLVNGSVDIAEWYFGSIPLYAIGAIIGTLFTLSLSKSISSTLLQHFGRNSLIIMGTHQAFLLPIRKFSNLPIFPVPLGVLIYIGVIILEIPIIRILNKYVPFLVGKKRS